MVARREDPDEFELMPSSLMRTLTIAATLTAGVVVLGGPAQAREGSRDVALSLVRLIHLQKVCPRFMGIDQGLASTMARNLLVKGYEEFGADAFETTVATVSDEFTRSLAQNRDAEWCAEQREGYRQKNRDGIFR